ncbi:SWIM zinc finger domain-containing protein [Thermoanaerobacter kivui]|uniref:SWIM zinc finger domain-containing protein n=1 Tax=Thermoanaerobacter kivui TaxID=2325 RepID=A0A097ASN6_THEKI|nr:SWIM zinc finger family protein [Thermoanaerobacter kivui]AIS52840.1 SWIM zinc finger domain-containing protein [Thermoanaerobacter kivui]
MNIYNFEDYINETILDRGYDYYIGGNIIETYNQGDNEYIFKVQGSDDYEVIVKLDDNGEILYSECDCPYDFGPICKHQVAAFYKLLEIFNNQDSGSNVQKGVSKQKDIKEVLNNLSKEELIKIIVDITEEDETLKNRLIVRYSRGDSKQELIRCKTLIDSIVRKYTDRDGFISYRETYDFVSEMGDLLEKARDTEDILLALDIAFLVLEEAVGAFQYADDSDGNIGFLVSETMEVIGDIVAGSRDLDIDLREKIFNKLLEQSENKIFDGWESYRIDILWLCTEFADIEELRNKLKMRIEYLLDKDPDNSYKKYIDEKMLEILYVLKEKYGTKEEAEQFIKEHLEFTSFKELFIQKYFKEKDYKKVIELALEWEEQDKQYAGLVSKWKKIRYEAYKKLSLKEEQKKLAKELLFDGNFEYYRELKGLITGDKTEFYNDLKQELKNYKGWHGRDIYLKVILEENDLDELMKFVKENPTRIEEYADKLKDKFKDEVIEVYKKYIKLAASSSSKRSDYQKVCEILKRYKKIAGEKSQKEIKNELMSLYKKRPAFIDELSKIK